MQDSIVIENLTRKFPGFVLDNVSFTVPRGSIMGFVGENGAGKTTTLKLILNLMRRDSGSIRVFGLDNRKDERVIKEDVGVVFEDVRFHDMLTPKELEPVLGGLYANWDKALYNQYLQRFSLPENKIIKEYSKGMRMKLSIAAALAHHPKLLLLDEATSGLDPIVRSEILDIFLDFIQDEEHSILFSSHITSDLEKVADYITFLHEGRVVFSKSKDELLYEYGVLKCGAAEARLVSPEDVIRRRDSAFGCEMLVKDRSRIAAKYRDMVLDNTTIEDIMLFYAGREGK